MKNVYTKLSLLTLLLSSWVVGSAQYCSPTYRYMWDVIDEVALTNGTTNLLNRTAGWAGAPQGYTDYTIANVHNYVCIPGTNVGYKVTYDGGVNSNRQQSGLSIWIDWNDNKVFDSGERIVNNTGVGTKTGSFAVPATYQGQPTAGGTYRIRFQNNWNAAAPTDPCQSNYTSGEAEDYLFSVLYQENLGIDEILDPFVPSCSIGDSVIIALKSNSKTSIDSATIQWSLNDTLQTPYNWTGSISAGGAASIANVNLGALKYKYGDTLKVWLSLVNGDTLDDFQGDDTLTRIPRPGLVGTYSVGDPASDYDSLYKVIRDIREIGVCGNVIFNLTSKKHYGQGIFDVIPGITNNAEITFNSMAGDADSASINWSNGSSARNYVLSFTNTQNITFNDLTIEDLSSSSNSSLVLFENSNDIAFNDCNFNATYLGSSSNSNLVRQEGLNPIENISFDGCDFDGGNEAIRFQSGLSTKPNEDIEITDCSFNNHNNGGVFLTNTLGVTLTGNTNSNITRVPSSSSTFLLVDGATGSVEINNNSNITSPRSMTYGVRVLNSSGTPSNKVVIYNNRFIMGDTILTPSYNGIRLDNVKFYEIANNAISVLGRTATTAGIFINNSGANEVHNNIVANYGDGQAFNIQGNSSISAMNNNVLYAQFDLGKYGNLTISDLANWQNNYGFEISGISTDPLFVDSTLRTCNTLIDNIGTSIFQTNDVDGILRSGTTPDPGAFEYSAPSKFSVGDDYNICVGDTLVISAQVSAADTVLWNSTDTVNSMYFTQTGIYYAELFGACGNSVDSFTVVTNKEVELPNDTNLCAGESLLVSADISNGTYSWNSGAATAGIIINKRGQYFLSVNDSDGCLSSDTIEVTISSAVSLPNDTIICEGNNVNLDPGTGAGTYVWSNGSSSSIQFVDSSSTYWVQFTDPLNCISADTTKVTVDAVPFATFTQSQFSQSNWEFTADDKSGIDYHWSFGDGKVDSGLIWKTVNIYDTNAVFTVTLTVTSANCGKAVINKQVEVITVGSNEVTPYSNVSVYPNPTSGLLNVKLPSDIDLNSVSIKIIDLNGRVVVDETKNSVQQFTLNLNDHNLASGVYQLSINNASNTLFNGKITLH